MSSKECFHFTYLNRAFSINETGLNKRLEDNSKALKDTEAKISYSDGRYAAAGLFANFYRVYNDIKTGKRDPKRTDPDLAKKVMASKSFEEFLGNGMYLMFDGTTIENTGGNKGHINPFDAGTKETINPEDLKVCMLKDADTGDISYSKYDYAFYLMETLSEEDKSKLPSNLLDDIAFYKKEHPEQVKKFQEHHYEEEIISLNDFCHEFDKEINDDIQKNKISMKDLVKNALGKQNTRADEVNKADKTEEKEIEQTREQEQENDNREM